MTSRSLTEVYILMRNNAIQSRHIYSEQWSERAQLVRSEDAEAGLAAGTAPPWLDALEEAQYLMSRIKGRMGELREAQRVALRQPSLEEGAPERAAPARLARDLQSLFAAAHRHASTIAQHLNSGRSTERNLTRNVVCALAGALQELSQQYRAAQSAYLRALTCRDQTTNAYFQLPNFQELSLDDDAPGASKPSTSAGMDIFRDESQDEIDELFGRPVGSQKQLLLYEEENTKMVAQREEEVNKIVRSVLDLNEVFKDLAHMVQDQGTVLDRIDYNIEATQMHVAEGCKQLRKADEYQRKNRKMHCIFVLGFTITLLLIVLVVVKS